MTTDNYQRSFSQIWSESKGGKRGQNQIKLVGVQFPGDVLLI